MNSIAMLLELKKELETLFKDFKFDFCGNRSINFYLQNPPRGIDLSEDDELAPYQEIKLSSGSQSDKSNVVSVTILIVCLDASEDRQGWIDVQNQIDRIMLRFLENPVFGGCFEITNLSWQQAEEDYYPLAIGGVALDIKLPNIEPEGTIYD